MYDGERETTGQGIRFGVSGLTTAVFPVLAGFLVVVAWQSPFLLYGIAVPIAAVVYFRFDEPSAASGTSPDRPTETPAESTDDERYLSKMADVIARVHVVSFLVARAVPVFLYIGFLTYNSIVVVRLGGGTPQQAGVLVAAASVLYALSATQAGRISAFFDSTTYALVGANVCLGGGLIVFVLLPAFETALLGTASIGLGFGVTLSLYRSIVTDLAPENHRGGLVSVGETVGRVAATVSPVAIGVLVAALESAFGFSGAVRWTLTGVGLVGVSAGVASVLVMTATTPRSVYSST